MPETNDHRQQSPSPRRARPTAPRGQTYTHRNRNVLVPDGYLAVGYVSGVHGLHGELRVELYTDFPERFAPSMALYLGEALKEVTVVSARPHKNSLLLQIEGVDRREEADELRGSWLFIPESDAVALEDGTYWVHDIVGLTVETETGQTLGVIKEVLFTGANEVYVVETPATVNRGRDLLLPAIEEVVRAVDLDAGRMVVRLLPGLLDED
jgi:16S rRNA processing protein RimM